LPCNSAVWLRFLRKNSQASRPRSAMPATPPTTPPTIAPTGVFESFELCDGLFVELDIDVGGVAADVGVDEKVRDTVERVGDGLGAVGMHVSAVAPP
jgi:hypothetical protein